MRRAFDVVVALSGLLLLAPLMLCAAIAVKLTSRGPVLFHARRVGHRGREFPMLKFRSMRAAQPGPALTADGDARITTVGRWLRRTKFDEVPQLINVLRGEMNLVGPRPEDPQFVALYDERQRRILEIRPGITSAASVLYRNEARLLQGPDFEGVYIETILPEKLRLDLEYERTRTFWSDLRILFRTVTRR
jgi:lipopolysaccharide/colanic/teichoic acid biosynthesis glycosyltransferase